MHISFRSRMFLYNIIILIICMVLSEIFIINTMERYSVNDAIEKLSQESDELNASAQQLVVQTAASSTGNNDIIFNENAKYFAEKFQLTTGSRIQIFDAQGSILADSSSIDDSEILVEGKEQQYYAEVYAALNSQKEAYMYTKLNDQNYLMFATPIIINDTVIGVVRTVYSMQAMDEMIHFTSMLFIWTIFLAILVISGIMFISYKNLMQPISDVTQMSKDMTEGDLSKRFVVYKSKDEINLLKDNFNKMADEIENKINAYQEKQYELSLMLSNIESGVIAIDEKDKVITLNESAKKMFDCGNITDKDIKLGMLGEIKNLVAALRQTNEVLISEIVFKEKNLRIIAKYAGESTTYIDILVIIQDVTKDRLLKKEQNKFLSSISHELRTPLTTIIGYADMLNRRGTENTELTKKAIDTINKESQRLLRLVDDVLLMNKYDKLDFDMIFSDMDIDDVLNDVIEAMRMKSLKYGIDISYKATELPKILGDYDRIKQVFINVLDNAIKYSYEGGKINVTVTLNNNKYIQVDIRDYGIGVPNDMIDNVFEAFYRVDEERSRQRGGIGMGLSIVRQIIKSHGGEVVLSSQEGEGTLVSITLPTKNTQLTNQEDKK